MATQSVTVNYTVSWTDPTTADSGAEPLTGPNVLTGFNVYVSPVALTTIPETPSVSAPATATSAQGTTTALAGSSLYFYVTALDSSGSSPLSQAAVYQVPVEGFAPDAPAEVTISVTVKT